MIKLILPLALAVIASSLVVPFTKNVVDHVFKEQNPCMFLLTTPNGTSDAAKKAFYELAEETDEIMFSHSDSSDENQFFRKLAEILGVNYKEAPHIMYIGDRKQKHLFKGKHTKEALKKFLENAKEGSLEIYVKSSPVTEENNGPIMDLQGKTFNKIVMKSDKQFFIKLYAPWCPHSRKMVEDFEEVARMIAKNPNIILAQMDYTVNEIYGVQITGYPTLLFWKSDKEIDPIQYHGDRSIEDMLSFLEESTEHEWVALLEREVDEVEVLEKEEGQMTSPTEEL